MIENEWPYPGSRWWKFDFHTHTPASKDTRAWQNAVGTDNEITPDKWLLKYMTSGIDCVAVTDHNNGAWIDSLKATYADMKSWDDFGVAPQGFRELTIFPGVEISALGGVHILAIFDPSATTSDIDTLLGKVDYAGTKGDSDGETRKGVAEVIEAILSVGAVPIPAHADSDKGLLRVNPGTHESALSAHMVIQAITVEGLLAVEWLDSGHCWPQCVQKENSRFAHVLGSDSHNFQGGNVPGSRYTWVKMATPTLEGLRLALLDGDGVSIRRSDGEVFNPFETPRSFVTAIEIDHARFMGNGNVERLELSPYYNALIGGRGTGKSTLVHAARLVFRRDGELNHLGEESEPRRQFSRYCKIVKGRDGEGALRENTELRIELMREGVLHRLHWHADGQGVVVEERNDQAEWENSTSQTISAERFPIRLFSQGQIAAMAGDSRQALLDVIDEAANAAPFIQAFEETKRAFFTQCAKLRELDGKLVGRPELERKLADLKRKLETFTQSHHAEVLKAHGQAQRQQREVEQILEQMRAVPDEIGSLKERLFLDAWPSESFDPDKDNELLAWRREADQALEQVRNALVSAAASLRQRSAALEGDSRLIAWRDKVAQAKNAYTALQAALTSEGVNNPLAFDQLLQERQQIERQIKQLDQIQQERDRLQDAINGQKERVFQTRHDITSTRERFLQDTLEGNPFVRIKIVEFGFDARTIERGLRDLLDAGDRFENDILRLGANGEPEGGLAFDLAHASDRAEALESIKDRLINLDGAFGGHFRNYLQRKLETPEFTDHLRAWFPEDDLQIEYSRGADGKDWAAITQGSQGQRSAAMLAFLLAFGGEPLVLDQPEDDLDNHLIYDLIVRQIRENKQRRQLVIVTHNPNVVVNGDAEMVHALGFRAGQCRVMEKGALQEKALRDEVCRVMEGGYEAFKRRWTRLGKEV